MIAVAPSIAGMATGMFFTVVIIAIVAVLGHRLREAGMEQETLATELQRVRLEADDILRNIRSGVLTVDGLKMGKSLDNFVTAARALAEQRARLARVAVALPEMDPVGAARLGQVHAVVEDEGDLVRMRPFGRIEVLGRDLCSLSGIARDTLRARHATC